MSKVAWDTETRGLDWFDPAQQAFLHSWADETQEVAEQNPESLINELSCASIIAAHNLSFDAHQTRETWGLDVLELGVPLDDTNLMSHVLFPEGQAKGDHGLKNLATVHLDPTAKEHEEAIEEMAKSMKIKLKATNGYYDVWRAYPEVMEKYARYDARYTYDLHTLFTNLMKDNPKASKVYYELERPVIPILIRAEARGTRVDQDAVLPLKKEYTKRRDETHAQCVAELGEDALGGEGSQDALTEALLKIGVPLTERTDSGKLATNKFALAPFHDDFPVLRALEEYRTYERFLSTYIGPMVGRETVHPSFRQIGAWTGRMSCTRPNMQNIPKRAGKEVRRMFVPREGFSFIVADYDSIEARLLAYYLGNKEYRALFEDGHDPHAWMAANIDGGEPSSYEKGTPGEKQRDLAKNVTYAICYGAGRPRVSAMTGLSIEDSGALIRKVKKNLPGFYKLNKRIKEQIEDIGYVNTLFGRKQPVKKDKAYVGLNALIQGSAADIMKAGLINVDEVVKPLGGTPILVVHDEVVVEVPNENAREALTLVEEAMVEAYPLAPTLAVEGSIVTTNYAEA